MFLSKLLLLYVSFVSVKSYKILGVFPVPSHSHFTLGFRLMKELADRGHEVAFINSNPQKEPVRNFRDISVESIKEDLKPFYNMSYFTAYDDLFYHSKLRLSSDFTAAVTRLVLNHKNVRQLMNSNEKFDVVILEHLLNEALFIFAHKFNCPLILLAPGPTTMFNNHLFANPAPSSYVTNLLSTFDSKMSFWERLDNTYQDIVGQLYNHFEAIPQQNELLKDAYPDAPDLRTILYNVSLMLTISHVSLADPVPLQQNIKQIGGYHISPVKDLPKEIKDFMDNSKQGVVVFTMGSIIKSSNLDVDAIKKILKIFSKIKQNVLFKFEEDLPEKPDNVKIFKWIPQADVLAHPNTVAFISHGGLLGTTEAVHYGVPMLGIPVFWDGYRNVQNAAKKGMAIKVDFKNLGGKEFEYALNELLNNPKYRESIKKHSLLLKDNPLKPMDEAEFWIKYVIRHAGAPHLRSEAVNLRWYQLYLVDIAAFVTIIIVVISFSLFSVLSCCFRKKTSVRSVKIKNDKKNK